MPRTLFGLLLALAAQQPPAAQPAVTFRAGVEYVELDAIVSDQDAAPLGLLRQVADGGRATEGGPDQTGVNAAA